MLFLWITAVKIKQKKTKFLSLAYKVVMIEEGWFLGFKIFICV